MPPNGLTCWGHRMRCERPEAAVVQGPGDLAQAHGCNGYADMVDAVSVRGFMLRDREGTRR